MWWFKKKKRIPITLRAFIILFPCCTEDYQQEMLEILRKQKRPDTLCGQPVPKDLNSISYGTLDDLHSVASKDNVHEEVARILLGVAPEQLDKEDVNKVFGFTNFVTQEILRINKIFDSIKLKHSAEEIQAGIDDLDFGSFGVLDWYAKRQGIVNQNDVRDVAWVRIFQCMKMDNQRTEFEKRLHEVYNKKSKRKK